MVRNVPAIQTVDSDRQRQVPGRHDQHRVRLAHGAGPAGRVPQRARRCRYPSYEAGLHRHRRAGGGAGQQASAVGRQRQSDDDRCRPTSSAVRCLPAPAGGDLAGTYPNPTGQARGQQLAGADHRRRRGDVGAVSAARSRSCGATPSSPAAADRQIHEPLPPTSRPRCRSTDRREQRAGRSARSTADAAGAVTRPAIYSRPVDASNTAGGWAVSPAAAKCRTLAAAQRHVQWLISSADPPHLQQYGIGHAGSSPTSGCDTRQGSTSDQQHQRRRPGLPSPAAACERRRPDFGFRLFIAAARASVVM